MSNLTFVVWLFVAVQVGVLLGYCLRPRCPRPGLPAQCEERGAIQVKLNKYPDIEAISKRERVTHVHRKDAFKRVRREGE